MPVDWLGQLSPTMKQQISLQRALLALQREDEQIRMETMPQPTAARGTSEGAKSYAGPTPSPAGGSSLQYSALAKPYFREGAGGLEEMLRAAEPVTGKGLDIQAVAWAKRKEIVEGKVVGAKDAYDRIITLDPAGQKVALTALRKYKPAVHKAMEKEGLLSPAGTLVQQQKGVLNVSTWTDEDGWLNQTTVFEDGTTETEIIGRGAKEPVEGPTVTEIINLQKLGIQVAEHEERFLTQAIKTAGDMPRAGIDMITEDGKDRTATTEDEENWKNKVRGLVRFYAGSPGAEAPVTMEDVKAMYEGKPEILGDVQEGMGLPRTGVWDEATEAAFATYGGAE